jgi:hypothetical protein
MSRTTAGVPGYLTVAGSSELLHLAPRSVRDLIYTGRLPSVRLGRRHYVSAVDVDMERRRRLGLPLPKRRSARRQPTAEGGTATRSRSPRLRLVPSDGQERRRRAAERAAVLERWLRAGHHLDQPRLPFVSRLLDTSTTCSVCGNRVGRGARMVAFEAVEGRERGEACSTCARRALLAWADERRREAAAARQAAQNLALLEGPRDPSSRSAATAA